MMLILYQYLYCIICIILI